MINECVICYDGPASIVNERCPLSWASFDEERHVLPPELRSELIQLLLNWQVLGQLLGMSSDFWDEMFDAIVTPHAADEFFETHLWWKGEL